jgi:hypothetical protein
MVIADVPTIALPFAYFPLKYIFGIIYPLMIQITRFLFAKRRYYSKRPLLLTILGDYYTNGSYGMRFESSYAKRYAYRGNLNFRFENLITSERGYPDYLKQNYNLQWSHSRDESKPKFQFSASVNLGSSKYFQRSINQANIGSNLINTLNSSISYSKHFNQCLK